MTSRFANLLLVLSLAVAAGCSAESSRSTDESTNQQSALLQLEGKNLLGPQTRVVLPGVDTSGVTFTSVRVTRGAGGRPELTVSGVGLPEALQRANIDPAGTTMRTIRLGPGLQRCMADARLSYLAVVRFIGVPYSLPALDGDDGPACTEEIVILPPIAGDGGYLE